MTSPTALDGQIRGTAVRTIPTAIEAACGFFETRTDAHLGEYGLTDSSPQAWYDVTDYVAVVEDLLDSTGQHTVRRIGKALAHAMVWDREVEGLGDALATLEDAYYRLHRGTVGGYRFERTGAESGRLGCETPYPVALEQGVLRGLAQRFTETGFITTDRLTPERRGDLSVVTFDVEWWNGTDIGGTDTPRVESSSATGVAGAD